MWGHWGTHRDTEGHPLITPVLIEGSQEHMGTLQGGNMRTLMDPQATPCLHRGVPGHWETLGVTLGDPQALPHPHRLVLGHFGTLQGGHGDSGGPPGHPLSPAVGSQWGYWADWEHCATTWGSCWLSQWRREVVVDCPRL